MKILSLSLAAAVLASALVPAAADARPRHKVCRTSWVHHHRVRRCSWH